MPRVDVVVVGLADTAEVVRFVEAGANGYLMRDGRFEELAATVEAVHRGRTPCEPGVAARVLERLAELAGETDGAAAASRSALSEREVEVLVLVADGLSNKEIAGHLGLALSTVKNHVHNLLGKLGVGRRRDAVRTAYEQGLIDHYLPLRRTAPPGVAPDADRSS